MKNLFYKNKEVVPMELKELIKTRRTVHEFSDKVVSDSEVMTALEMALWAPNHKNTHPWIFFVIGPKTREKLIQLAIDLKGSDGKQLPETKIEKIKSKLGRCSHMVAMAMNKSDDAFREKEDYATLACGIQNLSLYLHNQNIGSKWSTGKFTRHPKTYEILELNSDKIEIVGVLLIGHSLRGNLSPPQRPNLQDTIIQYP